MALLIEEPLNKYLKLYYLIPVFLLVLLIFLFSLWGRSPDIDDAWIGEHAYWQAKDGYARSELMRGIVGQENRLVIHHKFFNLHGVLFIKLFGFSLYTLKSVTLLYFLIFCVLFFLYSRKMERPLNKEDVLLSLVMLLCFHYSLRFSFVYRPEIMMMTFGFGGFMVLEKYLRSVNQKEWMLLLSGLFFGLSMATHLNGLILCSAGFLLLLWNGNYLSVFGFGIGLLCTLSIYFFDFNSFADFGLWKHQLFDSPSFHTIFDGAWWLKPLVNLYNEHFRYFYDAKVTSFSIFFFTSLIAGFNHINLYHKNLFRFFILVTILTALITKNKGGHYLLLNLPYMLQIIILVFKAFREHRIQSWPLMSYISSSNFQRALFLILVVFVIVSSIINFEFSKEKFSADQNRQIALRYAGDNARAAKIVAPLTFIFNEIENFDRIQGDLCYKELQRLDPSLKGEKVLEKMDSFEIELGMFSKKYHRTLGMESYEAGDTVNIYKVIDRTEDLLVFKRLPKF